MLFKKIRLKPLQLMCLVLTLIYIASGCSSSGKAGVSQTNKVDLQGRVEDSAGRPVGGIKVYLLAHYYTEDTRYKPKKLQAMSQRDGTFIFKSLQMPIGSERFTLIAYQQDKWLGWVDGPNGSMLPESVKNREYRIVALKPGVFTAKIVDEQKKPIPNATVESGPMRYSGGEDDGRFLTSEMLEVIAPIGSVKTDSNGVFRLAGVPEGATNYFQVKKHGYAPDRKIRSDDPKIRIMARGGSITGRLVDLKGKGVEGVRLDCWDRGGGRAIEKTGKNGYFTVHGLIPGRYQVGSLETREFWAIKKNVAVKVGKTVNIGELRGQPGVMVEGQVIDAGTKKPVPGGMIYGHTSAVVISASAIADKNGNFKLWVLPGDVRITYWGGGSALYPSDNSCSPKALNVSSKGMKNVVLAIKKADIAKCKVADTQGRPLSGAQVRIGSSSLGYSGADGIVQLIVPAETGQGFT